MRTTFIIRRPVLTYFLLTFAISWGLFLIAVGPQGFGSANWETETSLVPLVVGMLAGPALAGIFLIVYFGGGAGLRHLVSRLMKWRVSARWYLVALLPAPILSAAPLFALSLTSPLFTSDDKLPVVLASVGAGMMSVFEEIGWTGFAVPVLRRRHSVVKTGLILGVVWGAWHLLQQIWISGTYSAALPLAVYLPLSLLVATAGLTAYRVLMVWVYEHTGSLLVVTLMHASLVASNIFLFRPVTTGVSFLMYGLLFDAALWMLVAVVHLSQNHTRRPALITRPSSAPGIDRPTAVVATLRTHERRAPD